MFGLMRVLLTVTAFAFAAPAGAQAPAPTTSAFDGTYAGVSSELSRSPGSPGAKCSPSNTPPPLTITNGVARTRWADMEGSVSPQGALTMRSPNTMRFAGQIDGQGTVRGQYTGSVCFYTLVWQKKAK
jgi:hypothetical protein